MAYKGLLLYIISPKPIWSRAIAVDLSGCVLKFLVYTRIK